MQGRLLRSAQPGKVPGVLRPAAKVGKLEAFGRQGQRNGVRWPVCGRCRPGRALRQLLPRRLESGAGKSTLARKSNNHFGIKCGGDWTGRTVRHDDDARNECFRAYKHPRDSYEDHSKFLKGRSRYASLFKLKITDYKGWAHGLKKAGYATDPRYAYRLIDIIELYELHKYDTKDGIKWMKEFPNPHQPYLANDLLYIVVRPGDTFKKLSKEFDISQRKLRKYNDLYKGYVLKPGDIIYLDKKHRRADKEHIIHVVRGGESMYSISQKYGIRLKNLYKMNKMKPEDPSPKVGDILRLR